MAKPRASTLLLQASTLLAGLPQSTLEDIAEGAQRRTVAKGGKIALAGESPQYLFIVVSGVAHSVMTDNAGNQVILSILKPGDHFCDAELLEDLPLASTVVARENCDVLMIGKSTFQDLIAQHHLLSRSLFRHLMKRARAADNRFGSLALKGLDARLADFLLCEAHMVNGTRVVDTDLTNRDIGQMIGASREGVSRAMKELRTRGYLERRGKSIVLREQIVSLAAG
jgi:CRP/FNR family cyclic AMP-dependent transcriptional regulator